MSIRNNYQEEISKKLNYFANWLPNRPISIGDAGELSKKHFEPEFNLEKIKPETFKNRVSKSPFNIQYYSEGSAKIEFGADGRLENNSGLIKSGQVIKIKFEKDKSIFFEAKGAIIKRLEHFNLLQNELINRFYNNDWPLERLIVTETVQVETTTIIITNKANAEVVLRSENDLKLPDTELITVNGSFSIEDRSSTELCMIATSQIIPLFKLSKLKKNIFLNDPKWDKSLYARKENEYILTQVNIQEI